MHKNKNIERGPNLKTSAQVTAQMGKIYRKALRGDLELDEYRVLNDGLNKMRDGMFAVDLERRLGELENCKQPQNVIPLRAVK